MNILNENPQSQAYPQPQSQPVSQTPKQELVYGLDGGPKTMFILGLAVGVGSMALIALIAIIAVLLNGTNLNIAKAQGTEDTNNPAVVADNGADTGDTAEPTAGPVPEVTSADHIRGKADAKVTIIEYSDFQCPYCQKHADTLAQILKDFPNDVRLVYRHFPLSSIHPFAEKAGEASECANKQGKFWEMYDQLLVLGKSEAGLSLDGMKKIASDIGLNTTNFNTCLDNGETASIVEEQYTNGTTAGVSGTPANFVNGNLMEGALPYETFKQAVQQAGAQS
jgi:protein-disulfide isomerase